MCGRILWTHAHTHAHARTRIRTRARTPQAWRSGVPGPAPCPVRCATFSSSTIVCITACGYLLAHHTIHISYLAGPVAAQLASDGEEAGGRRRPVHAGRWLACGAPTQSGTCSSTQCRHTGAVYRRSTLITICIHRICAPTKDVVEGENQILFREKDIGVRARHACVCVCVGGGGGGTAAHVWLLGVIKCVLLCMPYTVSLVSEPCW